MKILMVTPELTPYAKMGGLGDMVAALSKSMSKLGHDVRIVLPKYGCVPMEESWVAEEQPLCVYLGANIVKYAKVWRALLNGSGVTVYFLEYEHYFHRHEIYTGPWGSHGDNNERFTFLSRASIDLCNYLNWIPDVMHCHDWTTGFVPVYLNTREAGQPMGNAASVFTIHNLKHQGVFGKEIIDFAGLPHDSFRSDGLEALGNVNMMKGGLYHATKITTVSPNYAHEIETPEYGCGLEGLLKFRSADLIGILNGIDEEEWDPTCDPMIPGKFSSQDLSGKSICKRALQERFGLEVTPKKPIFAAVARLYEQKGLDLLADIIPSLMSQMHIQIVVLGTGEPGLQQWFQHLGNMYKGRVGVFMGFDNSLVHLIEAGADFFIMPSRFEPCGLNQMYSMVYGTLPIVRATGGLVDTVKNYEEGTGKGTGFVFKDTTSLALYNTIGWACATYYDNLKEIEQLRINAMNQDFSWKHSAQEYEKVYKWAVDARLTGQSKEDVVVETKEKVVKKKTK